MNKSKCKIHQCHCLQIIKNESMQLNPILFSRFCLILENTIDVTLYKPVVENESLFFDEAENLMAMDVNQARQAIVSFVSNKQAFHTQQ